MWGDVTVSVSVHCCSGNNNTYGYVTYDKSNIPASRLQLQLIPPLSPRLLVLHVPLPLPAGLRLRRKRAPSSVARTTSSRPAAFRAARASAAAATSAAPPAWRTCRSRTAAAAPTPAAARAVGATTPTMRITGRRTTQATACRSATARPWAYPPCTECPTRCRPLVRLRSAPQPSAGPRALPGRAACRLHRQQSSRRCVAALPEAAAPAPSPAAPALALWIRA